MTTIQIAPTTQSECNASTYLGFNCTTRLAEDKQIILLVDEVERQYNNNRWQLVKTGNVVKYRLEELHYSSAPFNNKPQVVLNQAVVRGFKKDGGLRFRTETLYSDHNWLLSALSKEVIAQIPDEYHDIAREQFAIHTAQLMKELKELTKNGIKIK